MAYKNPTQPPFHIRNITQLYYLVFSSIDQTNLLLRSISSSANCHYAVRHQHHGYRSVGRFWKRSAGQDRQAYHAFTFFIYPLTRCSSNNRPKCGWDWSSSCHLPSYCWPKTAYTCRPKRIQDYASDRRGQEI